MTTRLILLCAFLLACLAVLVLALGSPDPIGESQQEITPADPDELINLNRASL